MGKVFVSPGTPKEVITLIGRVAIETAFLDLLVGKLLGKLQGLSEGDIVTNIHPKNTSEILDDIKKNTKDKTILSLMDEIKGVQLERNLVIHGIGINVSGTPNDQDNKIGVYQTITYRRKYKLKPQPRTEQYISALVDRIGELNGALCDIVVPCDDCKEVN